MKRFSLLATCVGVSAIFNVASARADLPFSYTAPGGQIPLISQQIPVPDNTTGVSFFPLFMTPSSPPNITSLELALNGLSHANPEDLDIFLINPFGAVTTVMADRGDGVDLTAANLVFNDSGSSLPAYGDPIASGGPFQTEEGTNTGLSKYLGTSGGTDAWILVVIDDASGDRGSLTSFTLRGTYVPEPVSLSLLALGALTALRRSRRKN
jgi:hypothetical protein